MRSTSSSWYGAQALACGLRPGRGGHAGGTESVDVENQHLRATLSRDSGWGIVSLIDKRTGREVMRSGEVGNAIVPYADDGGLYRFGSEMKGIGWSRASRISA